MVLGEHHPPEHAVTVFIFFNPFLSFTDLMFLALTGFLWNVLKMKLKKSTTIFLLLFSHHSQPKLDCNDKLNVTSNLLPPPPTTILLCQVSTKQTLHKFQAGV